MLETFFRDCFGLYKYKKYWIPASAGMTKKKDSDLFTQPLKWIKKAAPACTMCAAERLQKASMYLICILKASQYFTCWRWKEILLGWVIMVTENFDCGQGKSLVIRVFFLSIRKKTKKIFVSSFSGNLRLKCRKDAKKSAEIHAPL